MTDRPHLSRNPAVEVGLVLLLLAAAAPRVGPATGAGETRSEDRGGAIIGTDVMSSGGGTSVASSYKLDDTFGQGPVGPSAVGAIMQLEDGFWATIRAGGAQQDTTPPGRAVAFEAVARDEAILLRWTNPPDADFDHALIRFSTVTAPTDRTEGDPVPNGNAGLFANAPASVDSFVHTGIANGVTHYYSIWCADRAPNYSGYRDAGATPQDTIPPARPDYFTATAVGEDAIRLRWKNPHDTDLEEVRIRYSTSSYPMLITEGLAVENGNEGRFPGVPAAADSFVHEGRIGGVTYHYSIFALDEAMNYARPPLGAMAATVDNSPPMLDLSVFQNPYLTQHLDIYLIASEEVQDASVSVEVNNDPITMVENDSAKYVYRGDYDLCCNGEVTIDGCAADLAGHDTCSTRQFSASLVAAASGGVARSVDGRCEVRFPGRAVADDAFVLVFESGVSGDVVYEVSPQVNPLNRFVEIAIAHDAATDDPEHLSIARVDGGAAKPLDSYLDRERRRILAYVDRLGSYALIRTGDAVTPDYGSGGFRIAGNAPNPFVETTSIEFDVARAGMIEAEIVSIDGRHVRTLSEDFVPPGRRSLIWDGCDDYGRRAAGGVYVCTAVSGGDRVSHKLISLR